MINKWIHKRDTKKKIKFFYETKYWFRSIAGNLSPLIFIYHPPLDAVGYLMMVSATSEKMCIISILMSNIAIYNRFYLSLQLFSETGWGRLCNVKIF